MSEEPYRAYNFKLLIEGVTEGHFTEVSGLDVKVEAIEYREAGNAQVVRRIPGQVAYGPVTLRYGLTHSRELWSWLLTAVEGRVERKNVSILMLDSEGAVTYTLLRGAVYVKDNRLLPNGFDKTSALDDIAVRGSAVSDESFAGGSDRITYRVDLKGHGGPYTVSARLLYQAVSYRFAMDLFQDDGPHVERMARYYGSADHTPVVVAEAQESVR